MLYLTDHYDYDIVIQMTEKQLSDITQHQRDRLLYIELKTRFMGEIRRQDLMTRFGIQYAAATRDITLYRKLAPKNLDYNAKTKTYIGGEWIRPLFDYTAERVLTWLSLGYGDTQPVRIKSMIPCERPPITQSIDLDMLSTLARAINSKRAVEVVYRSFSSGLTTREIVPFAFADNGLRWHVRAFDRRNAQFRDFVLTRIVDTKLLAAEAQESELSDQDIQWNRIVELELVPHPANVQHPDTVEHEYGMENGMLYLRVRAALVGYLLRYWNVDCSVDHSLKGPEYHLWLRNRQTMYGVTNLVLAPGYQVSDEEKRYA